MGHPRSDTSESRFAAYVEGLASVIGHADRANPLRDYCVGLMLPCERKSVEPMAAVTAPGRTAAQHQSLLHFVGQASWSDEKVLTKVREMVLPQIERHGPIEAWIIDDTGFPKQGRHSVGVARQYCGCLLYTSRRNRKGSCTARCRNHHAASSDDQSHVAVPGRLATAFLLSAGGEAGTSSHCATPRGDIGRQLLFRRHRYRSASCPSQGGELRLRRGIRRRDGIANLYTGVRRGRRAGPAGGLRLAERCKICLLYTSRCV